MGQIKNIKLHIVTDIKRSSTSPAHPSCDEHQYRRQDQNHVRHDLDQGVGRRFSNTCLKKADIDMNKRAGELSDEEVERLVTIMQNPRQYKIPDYYLNRPKDVKDGKYSQILANGLENKLREDLERLKKIKAPRGLRHYWGLRVRGQHTTSTGHKGKTVGVSKKK